MTHMIKPNSHRWLITAISPSQETIQFWVDGATGFAAMAEASANPNCADVIKLEKIIDNPRPLPSIQRPSWIAGADGRPTGLSIL
jgi:hypothetical protein